MFEQLTRVTIQALAYFQTHGGTAPLKNIHDQIETNLMQCKEKHVVARTDVPYCRNGKLFKTRVTEFQASDILPWFDRA